jgi:hypothetical protein
MPVRRHNAPSVVEQCNLQAMLMVVPVLLYNGRVQVDRPFQVGSFHDKLPQLQLYIGL